MFSPPMNRRDSDTETVVDDYEYGHPPPLATVDVDVQRAAAGARHRAVQQQAAARGIAYDERLALARDIVYRLAGAHTSPQLAARAAALRLVGARDPLRLEANEANVLAEMTSAHCDGGEATAKFCFAMISNNAELIAAAAPHAGRLCIPPHFVPRGLLLRYTVNQVRYTVQGSGNAHWQHTDVLTPDIMPCVVMLSILGSAPPNAANYCHLDTDTELVDLSV